jgi:O-antigen ligase
VGSYVLLRNVLKYEDIVASAQYAYEVATGRAVTNESLLLVPAVLALTYSLFQHKWRLKLTYAAIFILFFGGLILTQSRGYWIGFLVGAVVLFWIIPGRQKLYLTSLGTATIAVVLAIGFMALGNVVFLLAFGILERLFSIFSAGTQDLSLINRFLETAGVWKVIRLNPILGYGMGVPYRVYDAIHEVTMIKAFVHNGYVALWFKFGLWGLGMVLFVLGSLVRRAVGSFRMVTAPLHYRVMALGALAALSSLFVSALTSNPYYMNDSMFIYGALMGIIGGCYSRTRP